MVTVKKKFIIVCSLILLFVPIKAQAVCPDFSENNKLDLADAIFALQAEADLRTPDKGATLSHAISVLKTMVGLTVVIEDTDQDGFDDCTDACPNEGDQGDGLDGNGCPLPPPDSDGDAIPDSEDPCPLDSNHDDVGDPCDHDEDGDGYDDWTDGCPVEFGEDNGCPYPDSDGDDIPDFEDPCPDDPDHDDVGDPCNHDEDGDGYDDWTDGCPDEFGENNGCPDPDSDGDGIPDSEDPCPDQFGEDNGCPMEPF